MKNTAYSALYGALRMMRYDPGQVCWQRNRWRLKVIDLDARKQLRIAMSGAKEDYGKFFDLVVRSAAARRNVKLEPMPTSTVTA